MVNSGEGHGYALRDKGTRSSIVFKDGNYVELLDDMDTSDSEHSSDDDYGWEQSELTTNQRRRLKKRNETCCSCGKQSSCKTMRCECRAVGGNCGMSCGCQAMKCSNREVDLIKESDHLPQSKPAEVTDETERSRVLVSHGAMLLQNALSEKPPEASDDCGPRRKPLSDIGNTTVKSNAPQPNQRKKWRKSVIQLVPVAPPPSQPENTETLKKPESSVVESDMPLKLPRAMRSAASNSNPLRERNDEHQDASVVNKEAGGPAPRSPQRRARTLEEKENHGL